MKPDWKKLSPSDPQYDALHVMYAVDAYGTSDFRVSPNGESPNISPDDHDVSDFALYKWSVTRVPDSRPTGPGQVRFIATAL
jgi:hypothetical protein